jgi:hypothetical protein
LTALTIVVVLSILEVAIYVLTLYIAVGYSTVANEFEKTQENEDNKKQVNHGGI